MLTESHMGASVGPFNRGFRCRFQLLSGERLKILENRTIWPFIAIAFVGEPLGVRSPANVRVPNSAL